MDKNPFPGMNPWLETHWGDVHTRLTTYACDHLQPLLPAGLRARSEEYVSVGGATAAAADPLLVQRFQEVETVHYIQVVDVTAGHRIVTSLEFLSLANKSTKPGRQQYRGKQRKMLDGRVNLVEIDLLRAGRWVLAVPLGCVPQEYREPYRISVVRAERPSLGEMYRVSLSAPLPTIRIPLRHEDADVLLNLQTLIDAAYVNGRYADDLDYSKPPRPQLTGPDAEWAERVLREQGLRQGG
jgi:hypothetical protein